MMEKKSSNEKAKFINFIKTSWAFLAGFLGAVVTIVNFVQLWRGEQSTVTYVATVSGGILLLILLGWFGFRRRKGGLYNAIGEYKEVYSPYYYRIYRWSRLALILFAISGIASLYLLYYQQQVLESKIVILVTEIDGPDSKNYRVTEELITRLINELAGYEDTLVIPIEEVVTAQQGSEYARKLGKQKTADIVLWGWYGPTKSDVRLTLIVENLSKKQFNINEFSTTIQTQTEIANLDSFTLQQNLSSQLSAITIFLHGFDRFNADDYVDAINDFNKALSHPEWKDEIISRKFAYFYRGLIFLKQSQYEKAIFDFEQAILLDPKDDIAYMNRGVSYSYLGQEEKAIADYSQAIQLDPKNAKSYNNRGGTYSNLGQEEKAIADYSQAIQLDPKYAVSYINRGISYSNLRQEEKAIEDYSQAILLDPENADAYFSRGNSYSNLGQEEKAIVDYSQAILLDPMKAEAYNNRGISYSLLGKQVQAIADLRQAQQMINDPKRQEQIQNKLILLLRQTPTP